MSKHDHRPAVNVPEGLRLFVEDGGVYAVARGQFIDEAAAEAYTLAHHYMPGFEQQTVAHALRDLPAAIVWAANGMLHPDVPNYNSAPEDFTVYD